MELESNMGVYTKAEVVIEHLEHFNIQMIRIFRSYVQFIFFALLDKFFPDKWF